MLDEVVVDDVIDELGAVDDENDDAIRVVIGIDVVRLHIEVDDDEDDIVVVARDIVEVDDIDVNE